MIDWINWSIDWLICIIYIYLKSNWLAADWISFEHDVDECFEGAERSPINGPDVIVRQQEISQRRETAKRRRRQRAQLVVPQVQSRQTTKSVEWAVGNVHYGVAGQIQMDQRVQAAETTDVEPGQLIVADVEHLETGRRLACNKHNAQFYIL